MDSVGVVREWHSDDGWGVVDSAETPGGCWVGFGQIAARGFRELTAGRPVMVQWEHVDQDGYAFRALKVWESGAEPWEAVASEGAAMRSNP